MAAAEKHIIDIARKLSIHHVNMEMGVINLRTDLFPWYMSQGYHIVEDCNQKNTTAEINRIVLEDMNVYLVMMKKELQ